MNTLKSQVMCVVVMLSSAAIAASQQPAPSPSEPPTASTAPPASSVPAGKAALQDGYPIKLALANKLDSHVAKNGDQIQLVVENDVVVSGVIILRRGTTVTGAVTDASNSKTMGRAGHLSFMIDDISLRNGDKVKVRAFNKAKGENHTGEMIGAMLEVPLVAAPFMLLIHGTNTVFTKGTEITAFVDGDVKVDLAGFSSQSSSEKAQ